MSDPNFDPYHKWLGIPPEHQPPNHYRLLGLELFESDPDVIESAAMRQMSHVRSFAISKHSEVSQSLLNEIAEAKLSLLPPERKKIYDEKLRKLKGPSEPVQSAARSQADAATNCPSCGVGLAINEALYGKTVKCTKCNAHCHISEDGKELRQPSVVIENKDVSPFGAFTQSGLQPFAGKSSAVSVPKGSAANRPRKKKSSFNWIAVIAVPTGVICGICLAIVLLWVVFKKDPLGIMVADTNVQQPNRSASAPIKPTDKKAPLVPNVNSNGGSASDSSELKQGTEPSPPPAVAPFDAVKAKEHQNSWAKHLGVEVESGNSIGMKFKLIPAGKFTMGGGDEAHEVTLTKPFMLGTYEVTQAQYQQVMGTNPSNFKGASNPVEQVNWHDAVEFCRKLSKRPAEKAAGRVYRLPTEAQWEYACRAGTTTKYSFGDDVSQLGDYAWFWETPSRTTHPVGSKLPNAWRLHDMHGNVREWCQDWYGAYPDLAVTDPSGAGSGSYRVRRGGSWGNNAELCRSANRDPREPSFRYDSTGFRVSLSPSGKQLDASTDLADMAPKSDGTSTPPAAPSTAPPPAIAPFDAPKAKEHQEAWAKFLGVEVETENSIGMKLRVIPAGKFTMGEGDNAHEVTLTEPYLLGTYEVTQAQYAKFMGVNPSKFKGANNPVDFVSWDAAVEFCRKLSALPAEKAAGNVYRLPTEGEWEFACRAGTTTKYSFGDDDSGLVDYAWFRDNSSFRHHPVGGKTPSAWGLHDMHGNIWEWCIDWWFEAYPDGPATDPTGPTSGLYRVARGGSWGNSAESCRSAYRDASFPSIRSNRINLGFRVCLSPSGK